MSADKPRRLGRGLEALLAPTTIDRGAAQTIPVAQVQPNPYQPRRDFKAEDLAELESSLRNTGLLQPIVVRHAPQSGAGTGRGYELIAGERRLRAATRLGWTDIPAVVKEVDDRTLLTLALVENLQRADLNPIEEAEGYRHLIEDFGLTQQQVADAVGKDRATVANLLRVLSLPASVRRMLEDGRLTLGHARALLPLEHEQRMLTLAEEIATRGLSVREVERRVSTRTPTRHRPRPGNEQPTAMPRAAIHQIEDQLRRRLQTDVRIALTGGERGTIEIGFYSADDLERVLDLIVGPGREGDLG